MKKLTTALLALLLVLVLAMPAFAAGSAKTGTSAATQIEFRDLTVGDSGDDVIQLQKWLVALDYLTGTADGKFGKMSASAVSAFQKDNKIKQTGIADVETQKAILAAYEALEAQKGKGTSSVSGGKGGSYVLNTNTKKFHKPSCGSVKQMKASNRKDYTGTRDEVIKMGYDACKKCNP